MSLISDLWSGVWSASGGQKASDFIYGVAEGVAVGAGAFPETVNAPIAYAAASEVRDGLNSAASGAARAFWRALPWWVWVGAAVMLFGYLGGFTWLRRWSIAKAVTS